jgi:hypothetical protein
LSALNRLANSTSRSARRQKLLRASLLRAGELSTPELLDLLEEALATRRQPGSAHAASSLPDLFASLNGAESTKGSDVHWRIPDDEESAGRKTGFRERMDAVALTADLFSRLFGVSVWTVRRWLESELEPPDWVWPAVRFYELLPPAERQLLLTGKQEARRKKSHPFARIEDL